MTDNSQIINLYTELAENPNKDFGWDKGLQNAMAHGYKQEWITDISSTVWDYCAAVGNPFTHADIKKGDTVLDLGCGAGVDVLVASLLVGNEGKVFGVDITPKMVEVATRYTKELNAKNVNILQSSFDNINLEDESVDIVISNGAINLTSCKESVFTEIYRVLKPNGQIFFADMIDISKETECCSEETSSCSVSSGEEDWANCVAGTMRENELIGLIQKSGFEDVQCTGLTHYTTAETTQGATFKATKISSNKFRESHWNSIYNTKDYTQVLWHQESPLESINRIITYAKQDDKIIDVGCGTSLLVDDLITCGYKNITLLDTSDTSLNIVEKRVYEQSIRYSCQDILDFKTSEKFDIWHDRAVFHFLTTQKERDKYFEVLSNSLNSGATAIISTFMIDGPIKCAGLNIVQYDYNKMLNELPSNLELVEAKESTHITPSQSEQKYIYFIIKKKD